MVEHYKSVWEMDDRFKEWIAPFLSDSTRFWCRACSKSYAIAEMYEKAVVTHSKNELHLRLLVVLKKLLAFTGLASV